MSSPNSRIVYSTDVGTRCPNCLRAVAQCVCKGDTPGRAGDSAVRVGRETQGRRGKGVTVITGLPLSAAQLETLATQLKKRCGSGGTVEGARIEIQGDHRDAIVKELARMGWSAKRSGG